MEGRHSLRKDISFLSSRSKEYAKKETSRKVADMSSGYRLILFSFLVLLFDPKDGDVFFRNVWLAPKTYGITTQQTAFISTMFLSMEVRDKIPYVPKLIITTDFV